MIDFGGAAKYGKSRVWAGVPRLGCEIIEILSNSSVFHRKFIGMQGNSTIFCKNSPRFLEIHGESSQFLAIDPTSLQFDEKWARA